VQQALLRSKRIFVRFALGKATMTQSMKKCKQHERAANAKENKKSHVWHNFMAIVELFSYVSAPSAP